MRAPDVPDASEMPCHRDTKHDRRRRRHEGEESRRRRRKGNRTFSIVFTGACIVPGLESEPDTGSAYHSAAPCTQPTHTITLTHTSHHNQCVYTSTWIRRGSATRSYAVGVTLHACASGAPFNASAMPWNADCECTQGGVVLLAAKSEVQQHQTPNHPAVRIRKASRGRVIYRYM